jgi:hypothetical protein
MAMPITTPAGNTVNPNGMTTAMMIADWATTGTISLNARPVSSDGRLSGATSMRSWAPDCISACRFEPVIEQANSVDMTMIPGTNHCSDEPSSNPLTWGSSGPKRARNTNGWTRVNTSENGLRSMGRSSRPMTRAVSATTVVMTGPPGDQRGG